MASSLSFFTIMIFGAMDVETGFLIEKIGNPVPCKAGTYNFYEGTLNGKKIIVCRNEIGMVNAASACTTGILKYNPDLLIVQGTAGGHNPILHRGDIVIGEKLLNVACMLSEKRKSGEGIHPEKWTLMDWELFEDEPATEKSDEKKNDSCLQKDSIACELKNSMIVSDQNLVEAAMKTQNKNGKLYKGTISSSDNWNRELDRINLFVEKYDSYCEDMESYAIAQVAKRFKVPCLPVRIISNTEQHDGEDYDRETGRICQNFVWDFVSSL